MAKKLKDLVLDEVSCVKAGANPGARILLAKTKDPAGAEPVEEVEPTTQAEKSKGADGMEITQDVLQAEIKKALDTQNADFQKRFDDMQATLQVEKAAREKAEQEQVSLAKQAADLKKQADEQADIAKREREERRLGDFVAIGKAKYQTLPLEEKRKGEVLKSLEDNLPSDILADVLKAFAAGNEALRKLTVSSVSGVVVPAEGSAIAKIEALAKDRADKKGISFSKARTEIVIENPDLYNEAQMERRAN